MRKIRILIFLTVLLSFFVGECKLVRAADEDAIQKMISDFQKETGCKSVSVVVYNSGEYSFYGDNDCLYQIGSMTKAFTGLAINKLICQGQISSEDYVGDLIPEFEAFYNEKIIDITVENLLEHKSGYTNSEKAYPSATEDMTLSNWAHCISGKELSYLPGTKYSYSNVNYNLLGYIIERVTGQTYQDYIEKEVLVPLGLNNTYVGRPTGRNISEGTRLCYRTTLEFPIEVRKAAIPAGYFYSNTKDMGRWIEIFTGNVDIPSDLELPIEIIKENLCNEGDYYSGWECFVGDVIGHSGGTPNYSSRVCFSDSNNEGVCVLTNLNVAASTDSLCNMIFDLQADSEEGKLLCDVWTAFDIIFTIISVACILFMGIIKIIKRRKILIIMLGLLTTVIVLLVAVLPIIFSAGLMSILFVWAPWSLLGGMILLVIDILILSAKVLNGKNNENYFKTGGKSAAYSDN